MNQKSLTQQFVEMNEGRSEKTRTSFNISTAIFEKFNEYCKERAIIPSDIIDFMIRDFLANLENKPQEEQANANT